MTTGYERVRGALEDAGLLVPSYSGTQASRCPAHDDRSASLSLSEDPDTGNALVYCHAGCPTEDIMHALGLEMRHLFSDEDVAPELTGPALDRTVCARYVYTDEQYEPLIRVTRTEPKGFFQERWEDKTWKTGLSTQLRRTLYHLPRIVKAIAKGETIYIVEGEKDAERLTEIGFTATCNIGGAGKGKWLEEYTHSLVGARCVVIPDLDEPGLEHAARIVEALRTVVQDVQVLRPAVGKDVSDHLAAGMGVEDLQAEDVSIELGKLDWDDYEVEEAEWLYEPYIPVSGRVLLCGKMGSLKSLWAMWLASKLASTGRRVAYFSLEMRPSQVVSRFKKLNPSKTNLTLFTKLKLDNPEHIRLAMSGLKGYDLIIIDSWSATTAKGSRSDTEVADLDNNVFQPIMDATGATVLLIDNTGHDVIDPKRGAVAMNRPRGSSAKGDKMDVQLYMHRPDAQDNYSCILEVTKMRYDHIMPAPQRLSTPRDLIEFYLVTDKGLRMGPAWQSVAGDVKRSTYDEGLVSNKTLPESDEVQQTSLGSPAAIVAGGSAKTDRATVIASSAPAAIVGDVRLEAAVDLPQVNPPSPTIVEEGTVQSEESPGGLREPSSMSVAEQLALARVRKVFGVVDTDESA